MSDNIYSFLLDGAKEKEEQKNKKLDNKEDASKTKPIVKEESKNDDKNNSKSSSKDKQSNKSSLVVDSNNEKSVNTTNNKVKKSKIKEKSGTVMKDKEQSESSEDTSKNYKNEDSLKKDAENIIEKNKNENSNLNLIKKTSFESENNSGPNTMQNETKNTSQMFLDKVSYNNQRLDNNLKSEFSKKSSKEELEKYAQNTLRNLSLNEEIFSLSSQVISQNSFGYRAFFVGNKNGTKVDFIEGFGKLLYDIGKIASPIPERIAFSEIPEYFSVDKLYIIDNLSDAVTSLFGNDDFGTESSMDQIKNRKKLNTLLKSPGSSYIVLDVDTKDLKGFKIIDPRIRYIFDKELNFPDLSNEDIFNFFVEFLPKDYAFRKDIDDKWKEYFVGYLERNKRYFPFNNKELAMYLANYASTKDKLELPVEKFEKVDIDKAFSKIVGLELVKKQIKEMQEYLITRQKLESYGIKLPDFNLHMLLLGNPGTGKCLPPDTNVLTPKGWVKIKDLKEGDTVIGGAGNPSKVLGVYPQDTKDFYEITFSDGSKQKCCAEHLWRVRCSLNSNSEKDEYIVIKTKEMLKDFKYSKEKKDFFKYSIDFVKPIEYDTKMLPMLPVSDYPLGAFLSNHIDYKKDKYHIKNILDKFCATNIDDYNKFIPKYYFFTSSKHRWELLNGLLDTNSEFNKEKNKIIYKTKSKQLSLDVKQLVLALGGQAILNKNLNENNLEFYELTIMFCKEDCKKVFSLKEKQELYNSNIERKDFRRYIENIEKISPQKGICIEVDDPTHTYIIDNYIITHNTTVARIIAHLLFDLGYIREDKLLDVTSKDLVAATGGLTGQKTNKVIMQAMGGVLFVDEAYSLAISSGTPGLEAIANLVNLI